MFPVKWLNNPIALVRKYKLLIYKHGHGAKLRYRVSYSQRSYVFISQSNTAVCHHLAFHAAMSDETALTQSMMGIDGQVS